MGDLQPTERFSGRAGDYARFRPGYPRTAFEFVRDKFGLGPGAVVADIGSGTGISSQPLLELGFRVLALEPNAAMRAEAEARLGGRQGFESLGGKAESTGLPGASVDLVLAAQAFHWFDVPAARAEFRRILRPGGGVALLWNERLETGSPFLEAYEELLARFGTDYAQVRRQNAVQSGALEAFFGSQGYQVRSFPNRQDLDFEGLKGRLLSSSYIPTEGHPRFEAMIFELRAMFEMMNEGGKVALLYDTRIYFGRLA